MEITVIETAVWEAMTEQYALLKHEITELCRPSENNRLKSYYDNQEVCQILQMNKRTLQNYRENGKIPFTRIEHKMYYRPADIEKFLAKNYVKAQPHGRLPK